MPRKGDSFQPHESTGLGTSNSSKPFDLRRMVQAAEQQQGQKQGEKSYTYPDPNTAHQGLIGPYGPGASLQPRHGQEGVTLQQPPTQPLYNTSFGQAPHSYGNFSPLTANQEGTYPTRSLSPYDMPTSSFLPPTEGQAPPQRRKSHVDRQRDQDTETDQTHTLPISQHDAASNWDGSTTRETIQNTERIEQLCNRILNLTQQKKQLRLSIEEKEFDPVIKQLKSQPHTSQYSQDTIEKAIRVLENKKRDYRRNNKLKKEGIDPKNRRNQQAIAKGYKSLSDKRNQQAIAKGYKSLSDKQNKQAIAEGHKSYWDKRNQQAIAEGYKSHYDKQNKQAIAEGHKGYSDKQNKQAIAEGYKSYSDKRNKQAIAKGYKSHYDKQNKQAIAEGYKSYHDKLKQQIKAQASHINNQEIDQFIGLLETRNILNTELERHTPPQTNESLNQQSNTLLAEHLTAQRDNLDTQIEGHELFDLYTHMFSDDEEGIS